jgi:hypothetical protein
MAFTRDTNDSTQVISFHRITRIHIYSIFKTPPLLMFEGAVLARPEPSLFKLNAVKFLLIASTIKLILK